MDNLTLDLQCHMFEPVSIVEQCQQIMPPKIEWVSYFVTEHPRYEEQISNSTFVYGLFDQTKVAFAGNQDNVLFSANKIFEGSESLTAFEDEVLNETFLRLAKHKPTRANRL